MHKITFKPCDFEKRSCFIPVCKNVLMILVNINSIIERIFKCALSNSVMESRRFFSAKFPDGQNALMIPVLLHQLIVDYKIALQ